MLVFFVHWSYTFGIPWFHHNISEVIPSVWVSIALESGMFLLCTKYFQISKCYTWLVICKNTTRTLCAKIRPACLECLKASLLKSYFLYRRAWESWGLCGNIPQLGQAPILLECSSVTAIQFLWRFTQRLFALFVSLSALFLCLLLESNYLWPATQRAPFLCAADTGYWSFLLLSVLNLHQFSWKMLGGSRVKVMKVPICW